MTESGWLTSECPRKMLQALKDVRNWMGGATAWPARWFSYSISDRKLRLIAWACYQSFRCYPGSGREREGAREDVATPTHAGASPDDDARYWCGEMNVPEQPKRASFLRDIIGNPWRLVLLPWQRSCPASCLYDDVPGRVGRQQLAPVCPQCRTPWTCPWLTPTVLGMAQTIYDTRRFEDMPILADALEDAGCDNVDILEHCRGHERCIFCQGTGETIALVNGSQQIKWGCSHCNGGALARTGSGWMPLRGPHARGCWAIDLLLGKD